MFRDAYDQAQLGLPTKNCSRSFDANCQDGAESVSFSLLSIMPANTLIMYNNDQIACELPHLPHHKSLTLC